MDSNQIPSVAIAAEIQGEIAEEIRGRVAAGLRPPGLATVLVGGDSASQIYVRNKRRACDAVGIASLDYDLPPETSQETLLALIDELNDREQVDGILVQLPLPGHIDETAVIDIGISRLPNGRIPGALAAEHRLSSRACGQSSYWRRSWARPSWAQGHRKRRRKP